MRRPQAAAGFGRTFSWKGERIGSSCVSIVHSRMMNRSDPSHAWHVVPRMLRHGAALLPLMVFALFLGMAIYHWTEGLDWSDSFLNAAMLLGGMGPVNSLHTTAGKWLAGF